MSTLYPDNMTKEEVMKEFDQELKATIHATYPKEEKMED